MMKGFLSISRSHSNLPLVKNNNSFIPSYKSSNVNSISQSFSQLRIQCNKQQKQWIGMGMTSSNTSGLSKILPQQQISSKFFSTSSYSLAESTLSSNKSTNSIPPMDLNESSSESSVEDQVVESGYRTAPVPIPSNPIPPHSLQDSFAVIHLNGLQFKVTNGDVIVTNRLNGPDIGQEIILEKVLLIGTKEFTAIGTPILENATVHAVVEEHTLTGKTLVFKKKRRKNYRRLRGHRQPITTLRILHITLDQSKSS